MEYALEEHGYSAVRVLRDQLAQRRGAPPVPRQRTFEAFLAHLDSMSLPWEEERLWRMIAHWHTGADEREDIPLERPPALLATLRSLAPGGPMNGLALRTATATKAAFDVLRRSLKLHITHCSLESSEHGEAYLLLGVYSPTLSAEVRLDDDVTAGVLVALHGEPGGGYRLKVLPRLYRKICLNGLVRVSTGTAQEIDSRLLLNAQEPERLTFAIKQLVTACFTPDLFDTAVNRLRQLAAEPVDAPHRALLTASLRPEVADAVFQRYTEQGDPTRWGLVNAVTAEARTASSALMLKLEQLGGVLAGIPAARTHAPRVEPLLAAKLQEGRRLVNPYEACA